MKSRLFISLVFCAAFGCQQPTFRQPEFKGALVSTRFKSFEALKQELEIEYAPKDSSWVRLTHQNNERKMVCVLTKGVSQKDFTDARDGGFFKKVGLVFKSPYFAINRNDLLRVYMIARRTDSFFGEGDIAFYDLATAMLWNINDDDLERTSSEDLSEKGYINTFNHLTSQAFMTSLFSEKLADFVADTHERYNMPELITGKFSEEQIYDLEKGPVDNYVDMINNEYGQALGNRLKLKYGINSETIWTPELLVAYLNDVQSYYSWVLQIGFKPFEEEDELIQRFYKKLNFLMEDVSQFK